MKLLESIKVGNRTLRNRIVMPPMETRLSTVLGDVTNEMIDYYTVRAKGGAGMIVVENTFVDDLESRSSLVSSGLYSDHLIRGKNLLAEALKENGAVAVIQLAHGGRQCNGAANPLTPIAPSPVMCEVTRRMPAELTIKKIKEIQDSFVQAARRAKQAGFDGVEIHGAHGYLISSFFSQHTNRRNDQYNGGIQNRARFAIEILQKVRDIVGNDFIVGIRMNGSEFYPKGGLTEKESPFMAKYFEPFVDYISVSGTTYETEALWNGAAMYVPDGPMVFLADLVKKEVNVPVITAGSLDANSAEWALEQEKADLVALGRALIADPELPNKLMRGDAKDILPCCRGNEGCFSRFHLGQAMRCELNPACGREKAYQLKTNARKKIVIIGGGVAGMEAARAAKIAGHFVALYERSDRLGGHLLEGTAPGFKEKTKQYLQLLERQLVKLEVVTILNVDVNIAGVAGMDADAVIIAVGSDYIVPPIEGIENAVGVKDALLNDIPGNNVVVIGGGLIGCETALMLAEQGKNVIVLEMQDEIVRDLEINAQVGIVTRMKKAGVVVHSETKAIRIRPGYIDCDKGLTIECDTVVNATGLAAKSDYAKRMAAAAAKPVYIIGDCKEAVKIYDATHSAWHAVLRISGQNGDGSVLSFV